MGENALELSEKARIEQRELRDEATRQEEWDRVMGLSLHREFNLNLPANKVPVDPEWRNLQRRFGEVSPVIDYRP